MQQLEKQAYIYCIDTADFVKSLEKMNKTFPNIQEIKKLSGEMYHHIADTHKANTNKEFADILRKTKTITEKLQSKLPTINPEEDTLTEKQKNLTEKLTEIQNRLNDILSKIIY
ncbi:MAG: hypothetical protein R6U04_08265 [Bacteroidales bacterium]